MRIIMKSIIVRTKCHSAFLRGQGASQEENYSLWLQSPVWSVMSLSLWFKVAFVLDADVYVTFNVLQQKLKSFQTKGKLKVYKKC